MKGKDFLNLDVSKIVRKNNFLKKFVLSKSRLTESL